MRILLILCFVLYLRSAEAQLLPSFGNSRTGTAGMQFLKTGIDARSMGMAGAVASLPNDASTMYWNPGGITQIDSGIKYNFALNHCGYFAKTKLEQAAFVYKNKFGYWGLQLATFRSPEMKETTEFQPEGTGRTFTFSNVLIGISYAQQLTNNFSFGLSGKYVNESFAGVTANNVLFDLGLFYNVHVRHTRFAAVISNFGINVKPNGEVTALKIGGPSTTEDFSAYAAPSLFRVAFSTLVFEKKEQLLMGTLQLNHPGDNNETFALGFEYTYKKLLIGRTGYEFGADEKGFPSLGFGLKLPRRFGSLRFDYGWQYKRVFGNVQRIGIVASLRK
jgi:hypothetical protein